MAIAVESDPAAKCKNIALTKRGTGEVSDERIDYYRASLSNIMMICYRIFFIRGLAPLLRVALL